MTALLASLARTGAVAGLARVAGLLAAVVLARRLGVEGYGLLAATLGAAALGGRIGALGWPALLTRALPRYRSRRAGRALARLQATGDRMVARGSLGLAAGMAAAGVLAGGTVGLVLIGAAVLVPVMAFRAMSRAALAGLGRPGRAIATDELLPPLGVLCLAVTPLLSSPAAAVAAHAAAGLAAVAWARHTRWSLVPRAPGDTPPARLKRAWQIAALIALTGLSARLALLRADIVMLPLLASVAETGLYAAAQKLSLLQSAPVAVLVTVAVPRITAALAAGRLRHARRLYRGAVAAAAGSAAVVGAVLCLAGTPALVAVFGTEFALAMPALTWLAVAQVAAAPGLVATGIALALGRGRAGAALAWTALLFGVAANLVLIPVHGAAGAAAATAAAMTLLTAGQLMLTARVLRPAETRAGRNNSASPSTNASSSGRA